MQEEDPISSLLSVIKISVFPVNEYTRVTATCSRYPCLFVNYNPVLWHKIMQVLENELEAREHAVPLDGSQLQP